MKLSVLFVLFATVFLALTSALPISEEEKEQQPGFEDETFGYEAEETGLRFQRATCDLLSVSTPIGSLNHAACAAHCLAMGRGFRGGRCRDGVCHCRR